CLHFVLIVGVILFALGLKRYLTTIAAQAGNGWLVRPAGIDDAALFGGVIVYVAGLLVLGRRVSRRSRLAPAVALIVLGFVLPAVSRLPALLGLGALALVCVTVVVSGLRRADPLRGQVRQTALEEQVAAESEQSEWRRRHL
ncbi:low temperature requirement protein A, partial [Micromonospora fluostatini]